MKILKGVVISDKMDKTIVVKKDRKVKHPKYKKTMKKNTKFFVHDEKNEAKIGDIVTFKNGGHISKKKNFVLVGIEKGQK